ncbi:MAG: hypothetical protein KJT03_03630 [Verrucomicrobiae bacterium]|nr:hypothetical protein [Verrucomicrobiae bacterium]
MERTPTNAATDSHGHAFGLSGNLFIIPIVGLVASLSIAMVCFSLFGLGLLVSILIAMPFLVLPLLYVILLRHNKPKGYDRDWFENFTSEGFTFVKANQPLNPSIEGGKDE